MSYWKERVERITSSADSNLNDLSTLITESNAFSAEEQMENKAQIIKLNKYITKATLAEFAEGLKNLKALENSVADETYMQMVGATQGQYIQLLLRLKTLDAKYANQFSAEILDATQKIAFLGQLVNAYKNKLVITDLNKNEAQRTRFIEWAKGQLQRARTLDGEGEAIASTWRRTRSSEAAVNKYVAAWQALMSIHPGDLHAATKGELLNINEFLTFKVQYNENIHKNTNTVFDGCYVLVCGVCWHFLQLASLWSRNNACDHAKRIGNFSKAYRGLKPCSMGSTVAGDSKHGSLFVFSCLAGHPG